jgi:hypothetical protein
MHGMLSSFSNKPLPHLSPQRKEPEIPQQKTSNRRSVETATNGESHGSEATSTESTVTKIPRTVVPAPKKDLPPVEKAPPVKKAPPEPPVEEKFGLAHYWGLKPYPKTPSSGAMKVDAPLPAMSRDIYSPDFSDGEEATPSRPEKRRKLTAVKTTPSRTMDISESTKIVSSKKVVKTIPHSLFETKDTAMVDAQVLKEAGEGPHVEKEIPPVADADIATDAMEVPSSKQPVGRKKTPKQRLRNTKNRDTFEVPQGQASPIAAASSVDVVAQLGGHEPGDTALEAAVDGPSGSTPSGRLATPTVSTEAVSEFTLETAMAVAPEEPRTLRGKKLPKKVQKQLEIPETPATSEPVVPANRKQPASSVHVTRSSKKDDAQKEIPATPTVDGSSTVQTRSSRKNDGQAQSSTVPKPANSKASAQRQKRLSKGANDEALPTPTASEATSPAEYPSSVSRQTRNNKTPATSGPSRQTRSQKSLDDSAGITPSAGSRKRPLEIPETPAATTSTRQRRSLPSLQPVEIPETPQEKPPPKLRTPSTKTASTTPKTPTTVTVPAPDTDAEKLWTAENALGLYHIPAHMLASLGTVWDADSGRRVSGRRHTVAFAPPPQQQQQQQQPEEQPKGKKKGRVSWAPEVGEGQEKEKEVVEKEPPRKSPRSKEKQTEEGTSERRKSTRTPGKEKGGKKPATTPARGKAAASAAAPKEVSYDFSDEE